MNILVSVVIRTLNEQRYLDELLRAIDQQYLPNGMALEVVIIDSGSSDRTLLIARRYHCRTTTIEKSDFTFGRSLNRGSAYADGDVLVYLSGHCIPWDQNWLSNLVAPVIDGRAHYVYGRQLGRDSTKYSEKKLFRKYFPETTVIPQDGFFCNNANAAIARPIWEKYQFNEDVTGLEDMELAKRLVGGGGSVAYVAEAVVYHIHNETWLQTKRRYEREAIALQVIMPDVHVSFFDTVRYFFAGVGADFASAVSEKGFTRECASIVKFRAAQYWGAYRGNHEHRQLSRRRKESYYYPNKVIREHRQ